MSEGLDYLEYRPLSTDCPRGAFSCGESDIDNWFIDDAARCIDKYHFRVTTAHIGDEAEPIGFYSLGLILEPERFLSGTGPIKLRAQGGHYPALHLEYIGVLEELQGLGIGTDMMQRVLTTFRSAVVDFGIPVLTLKPLRPCLDKFYADLGFVAYAAHRGEHRMMLTAQLAIDAEARARASIEDDKMLANEAQQA